MTELRRDPLTGRWVIIAAGRGARPNEFPLQRRSLTDAGRCPFCPGREDQTTPEVLALGREPGAAANSPGWQLRVFGNMYPAVAPGDSSSAATDDLLQADGGLGRHEVVVYSPDHAASPADQTAADWVRILDVMRGRVQAFLAEPGVRYVSPFCNHGPEAGATLAHPHLQIVGATQVPLLASAKAMRAVEHLQAEGACLLCRLEAREREDGTRIIAANERWTALAPWASRFPWEMLLVPRRHAACLADADDGELADLGDLLARVLPALASIHGDLSLNLVVHGTPRRQDGTFADPALDGAPIDPTEAFHWHVEILPRLSRQAGFEAGTGYAINSVWPEEAARVLREGKERT